MKKITIAFVVTTLMLAMFAITVFAGYEISATMYAGQTDNIAGYAKIQYDDTDSVDIRFEMRGGQGWCLTEFHVHAGLTFADFPTGKSGNLKPGHFDYKEELGGCITDYTLEIPLEDLAALGIFPGDEFFIVIHAVVFNTITLQEETSWTVRCGNLDGQQFPQNGGWAGYVRFTADAWLPVPPPSP